MRIPTDYMFQQQLAVLSQSYQNLARLTVQQANGKVLLENSDDPVLSSRIEMTYNYLNDLGSYKQNLIIAKTRTQLFDTATQDAVNVIDQAKQIIKQAASDLISDRDRVALGAQIKGYINLLLNDANTRDGNGEYIFGGYNTADVPYVLNNGKYVYRGGMNSTSINIGTNMTSLFNESGFCVFGNVMSGNGTFAVTAAPGNTGTASTTPGTVVNKAAYVRDTYTISFVTNGAGQLAYQIVGATSGQVVPPLPATIPTDAPAYNSDSEISFNGMSLHFNGAPNVGDTFTVAPSQGGNVFDDLNDLVTILNTPLGDPADPVKRAQFHQALSQSSAQLDNIFNQFVSYRSSVGVRMQVIENQSMINANSNITEESIYSALADIDLAQVASDMIQQRAYLEATQKCYTLIQTAFLEMLKAI